MNGEEISGELLVTYNAVNARMFGKLACPDGVQSLQTACNSKASRNFGIERGGRRTRMRSRLNPLSMASDLLTFLFPVW